MRRDLIVDFVSGVFGVNSSNVYFQTPEYEELLETSPFRELMVVREVTLRLLLQATIDNDLRGFQQILNSVRPQLAYELVAALACCELARVGRSQ